MNAKLCYLKDEVFRIPKLTDLKDLIKGLKGQIFKDMIET